MQIVYDTNLGKSKSGEKCAACGFATTLLFNYVEFHKLRMAELIADKMICRFFDTKTAVTCNLIIDVLGPFLIEAAIKKWNADIVC